MNNKKKVRNTIEQQKIVNNIINTGLDDYLKKNRPIVFDFSLMDVFRSVQTNDFDNFLKDEHDFIEKFKELMTMVSKLSQYSVSEIFSKTEFRHCHKIEDKEEIVLTMLRKKFDDSTVKQKFEGEEFYQAGYEKGVRVIGTLKGNVFSVVLVDYFHDLYPDNRRNIRSKKSYKYSL